jgi:hypothetical protein
MYIVAIGWMFVVVCMAAVEAMGSSVIGGIVTLTIYGVLPLGLFLWLVGTPQRRRNREGSSPPISGASFTPGRRANGDESEDE